MRPSEKEMQALTARVQRLIERLGKRSIQLHTIRTMWPLFTSAPTQELCDQLSVAVSELEETSG